MLRFRIWHLGLAVLWVAFLSWVAVSGRQTSEALAALAFWVAASVVSLGCTLLVGRPLARHVVRPLNPARHGVDVIRRPSVVLSTLSLGLFLACLFVGLFTLLGIFMEKLEPYLRGQR